MGRILTFIAAVARAVAATPTATTAKATNAHGMCFAHARSPFNSGDSSADGDQVGARLRREAIESLVRCPSSVKDETINCVYKNNKDLSFASKCRYTKI